MKIVVFAHRGLIVSITKNALKKVLKIALQTALPGLFVNVYKLM